METYNRKRKENFGHSRNSFNNYKNNIIYILILDNYIPIKKKTCHSPREEMAGIYVIELIYIHLQNHSANGAGQLSNPLFDCKLRKEKRMRFKG